MDALNAYGVAFGIVIGVLSAGASFFNRQKYQARIDLLQAGNDELRSQNSDLRTERADLKADLAACQARAEEREKIIDEYKRQPNFSKLVTIINGNHKEVMTVLTKGDYGKH